MLAKLKHHAFSLIELLVVIAIVGIIAAVALPTYRDYSIRAKIRSITPVVYKWKDLEMEYYSKRGTFANASQLGMTSVNPPYQVANAASYSKYLSAMYVNLACSNTGAELTMVMDNAALGYSGSELLTLTYLVRVSTDGRSHVIQCVWRTDGTTQTADIAARFFPSNCQTPSGNPTLVACPALP